MIWIILLGGMVQGAFAQNLEIKGMVRDARNKEILEFANVVLQTMDSSFVAGTTTDMKGHFLLNKIKKGSYILSVSSLGFKTEYISLESLSKNISLGEISLNDDAVSLDGVTVSASAQTSHADKKVVFPSDRQMKASGNGMDLLQQMMLPRVQVDLLNNEIKATGNGVVQVRINGVKVEQDEIKALNPSDIIRIEYHDNPGLRYGNADIVLDYIVRRPDTGGSFGLDMAQGINSMWGEHNVRGKINHKNSEWGASYRIGPRDFYGMKRNNEEEFHLANGTTLNRVEIGEPSRARLFMHNLNVNYSYQKPDKYLFNATFRYRNNHQPHWDYQGVLMNKANPEDKVDMIDLSGSAYQAPALDLYYQRDLKHNQTLVFNVVGTYNQTKSTRIYQESKHEQLLTDVNNVVDGDKYSIIGEAIYEKKLTNGNRLSGGLRHNQSFSDNSYINGHNYKTHMEQMESSVYAEFKGKVKKLDYSLGVTVNRSSYSQRGEDADYERYTVSPRLTLFYALPGESSIRLKSTMGNVTPSLGELSAIDQVIDSLQIQRGNPNLKSYMSYYTELNYEFRKGLFYVNALGAYEYQPDAIMDEKYLEGNKIIQTWDNQKNWQRVVASVNLRVGPIKDILQFSVNGGMNHYMSNGNTYTHRYTNWWCDANVSVTWKNWSLMYMLMTNWNWFKGETMSGGENIQGIQLGYRHKDLMVGLRVFNPFTDNYKQETENWNQYASFHRSNYIKESSRLFVATISYNFSFGRKFSAGQKKVNNADNDSGVMSTGK